MRKKMPHSKNFQPPARKKNETQHSDRHPVPAADPNVELILAKVRNVGQKICRIVVHGLTGEEPADVCPESAVARRVRVAVLVRVLVMHAMGRDPENWSAFKSQRAANG